MADVKLEAFEDWPKFHRQGLGCGLEDRGITDRYEAAEYGWRDCEERMLEQGPFVTLESAQQAVAAERWRADRLEQMNEQMAERIVNERAALRQAVDALERVGIVDDDCDILAPPLADAVSDAIEALRKELGQ
jgi:hypothetical protein